MNNHPDMSKKIVNANIDVSNIIPNRTVKGIMLDTLLNLSDILSEYCGPYAKYCILAPQVHAVGEPTFTSDGINIIKAIEYANPLQEFVKSMVVYIGKRIDTAGADGTTSSMKVVILALHYLISNIDDSVTINDLKKAYSSFSKKFKKALDSYTFTVEDLGDYEDMDTHPVYTQALTSSKGNTELARVIWELFKHTPQNATNFVSFERSQVETDKTYSLRIDTNEYECVANPLTKNILRGADGMSLDEHECKVLVFNNIIMPGTPDWNAVMQHVEQALESNEHLIILHKIGMPNDTMNYFQSLMMNAEKHNISFFTIQTDNDQFNDIVNIILLAGRTPVDQNDLRCNPIKATVKYENSQLVFNDFVAEESNDGICGLVDNPNYPTYNRVLELMAGTIEHTVQDTRNPLAGETARNLQRLFNKLYQSYRPVIVVGGTAYDNHEATDVCIDALGAARNIIRHGYTMGAMTSFEAALNSIVCDNNIEELIVSAFSDAIIDLQVAIIDKAPESIHDIANSLKGEPCVDELKVFDVTKGLYTDSIIQPANIDKEIIERFGEVALKFIKTDMVLIPHSVYKPERVEGNDGN